MEIDMSDLSRHPYFKEFKDPESGVVSYILEQRAATLQRHFYFAQSSVTRDGKYLWLLCANPPAQYMTLAVVSLDPDKPFIRHFPNAYPSSGLPCITPEGDGVYFCAENALYRIKIDGTLDKMLELPNEKIDGRRFERLCSHVTVSPSGRYVALDICISQKIYMAVGDLQTGEIKILNKFCRCYDHAMFCPTREDLILIDQDWWRDYHTGEYFPIDNRMWLLNTSGERFEPLLPDMFYGRDGTEMAHDYWSEDGYVCWSDYYNGAYECNVDTREVTFVWKRPIIHSHTSRDRQLLVGDYTPYEWNKKPCQVLFYDRKTNKEIPVFSSMPYNPLWANRYYHLDPHPQFCAEDSLIVSTTTVVDGRIDVALTPVAPVIELCRKNGKEVVENTKERPETPGWMYELQRFGR